ncbi:MAG: hypothetical protein GY855_04670 [candidate division Zixibacteria bacterium]|nr:hypothetical protein [candidate division Zixibacteria bacterium]
MKYNVSEKLIENHLVSGKMQVGAEISIKIDQTLTQDATGTMVMLELEAMQLLRAKTELSVQYVDHNLVQADFRNADDHLFLRSACKRFGIWFSRPGNGISHPLHMERFGIPGKTLLGSDSHTCSAGSFIVGGDNYGQGSSREHAAVAPRYLGIKVVIVKSFARIHFLNLVNFGILPLLFVDHADYEEINQGDELRIESVREALKKSDEIVVSNMTRDEKYNTRHDMSERQVELILDGGLINNLRKRR